MSFYSSIIDYYDQLFPLDEKKLQFVLDTISPQQILDIGCATGTLCHALYHKGHQIIGVDIDKDMIEKAKAKNPEGPIFKTLDMLHLDEQFNTNTFDQVLCFDNTLAHLPNEMAVEQFFVSVYALLKEKGHFKLEVINYEQALSKGMLQLPTVETDDIVLKRHQCLEQQFMECYSELNIHSGEEIHKNCIPLFPIRFPQIKTLLERAGFQNIDLYCDFKGCKPQGDHTYNVINATK